MKNHPKSVSSPVIFVKSGNTVFPLRFKEIKYIESQKEKVIYHTVKGSITSYHSLKKLIQKLPNDFMRIHQSFIINILHVSKIEDNHIFIDDQAIAIGKSYRECTAKRINRHLL